MIFFTPEALEAWEQGYAFAILKFQPPIFLAEFAVCNLARREGRLHRYDYSAVYYIKIVFCIWQKEKKSRSLRSIQTRALLTFGEDSCDSSFV